MSLGSRIRELRNEKKLTQEELGKILGVSKVSVSGYENDTRQPDNKALLTLSNTFGVTTDYLLGQNSTPSWATKQDTLDLQQMLKENVGLAFGGEELTDEDKQRLNDILTGLYWEKLHNKKKRERQE